MSFAIISNRKYKKGNLISCYRHNERKNIIYSNKEINLEKSKENYHIKDCKMPYVQAFYELRKNNKLIGQIKNTSNIACEYIVTSDREFFEKIDKKEARRYFECAYRFIAKFKNLGEENIISAIVHMDETTPHMHLIYIPVIHRLDSKSGKLIGKISCSEYWYGKNSYKNLQDCFYNYITKCGFNLERGKKRIEHIPNDALKILTNYELQKYELNALNLEKEISTDNIDVLRNDYRRIIKKYNYLANQYTKIKVMTDTNFNKTKEIKENFLRLKKEYELVIYKNKRMKDYIDKNFECVSILFDFPIDMLKTIVNNFTRGNSEKVSKEDEIGKNDNLYGR